MSLYIAAQCQQGDLLAGKRAGAKTGGAEQPRAADHALWGDRARFAGRVLYETTALGVRRNDPLIAYGTA